MARAMAYLRMELLPLQDLDFSKSARCQQIVVDFVLNVIFHGQHVFLSIYKGQMAIVLNSLRPGSQQSRHCGLHKAADCVTDVGLLVVVARARSRLIYSPFHRKFPLDWSRPHRKILEKIGHDKY